MKFIKSKYAVYLTDLLCCILLGASVCSILLPSAGIEAGYGDCMLLMAADLALVVLFSRKWWIFPAFLVTAVTFTLLLTTILDVNEELWAYIGGFIRWCSASYPTTEPYSLNGSIILIQLAVTLPAAVISYLYFRRLFLFALLPPIAFAVLVWAYFTDREVFWPVLVMLLLVIFLCMAKRTGIRINKSLPEAEKIPPALLVLSALIIAPVIIFFSFAVTPQNDGDWRSKWLVDMTEDFRDYFGWGEGQGYTQGTFDIGISGFSPLESRLGGNIKLDNNIVMRVTTDTPVLLKGAVFDTYDGHKWYDTGSLHRYRLTSLLWQAKRSDIFLNDKPAGSKEQELYTKLITPADIEISYSMSGRTLFSSGKVQSLESKTLDISDVFFNGQSELFTQATHKSLSYILHTVIFDRNKDDFIRNMLALEALTERASDSGYDAICAEYLQLPDTIPDSVYNKAKEITQGCDTAYQKAKAIESWLGEKCTYTILPGNPPDDTDFVASFLQTREGYCVYYASALTVLARCSGLPARYVTGYAMQSSPYSSGTDSYVATNATAHAWSEIYFKGIGWIAFDATNWNFYKDAVVERSDTEGYIPVHTPPPATDIPINIDTQTVQDGGMPTEVKVLLIVLVCLVLALAVFAAVRFILLLTGPDGYYRRICRKYSTDGDRLGACYSNIVRQAAFLGIKQQTGDTITSFSKRVDAFLKSKKMTETCECVILMRFALEEPKDSDISSMCAFSAELEKLVRKELGLSVYLWRRILIGK